MIFSEEKDLIVFYQKFSMMILASNIGLTGHFELSATETYSVRERVSNINWTYYALISLALAVAIFDLTLMLAVISGLMIGYNANRVKLLLLWRQKKRAFKRQLGFPMAVYIVGILILYLTRSLLMYFGAIVTIGIILNVGAFKANTFNYLRFQGYLVNLLPFVWIAILNWSTGYGMNLILPLFLAPTVIVDYTVALTSSNILLVVLNAMNTYESAKLFRLAQSRGVLSEEFRTKNRLVWRHMRSLILISFVSLYLLSMLQFDLVDRFVNVDTKKIILSVTLSFFGLTYVWDSKNILYIKSKYKELLHGSAISATLGLLIFIVLLGTLNFDGLIVAICAASVAQAIIFTRIKMGQWNTKG